MAVKVVDASAVAAMIFGEPQGAAVGERLSGSSLAAPAILAFEVASVCLEKLRLFPERAEALLEAFDLLSRMDVETVAVDHRAAVRLAQRSGLTAYDASYLWLARALDAELVTLDARLSGAEQVGASRDRGRRGSLCGGLRLRHRPRGVADRLLLRPPGLLQRVFAFVDDLTAAVLVGASASVAAT